MEKILKKVNRVEENDFGYYVIIFTIEENRLE